MGNCLVTIVDCVKAFGSGTEVGDGVMGKRLISLVDRVLKAVGSETEVGDGVKRTPEILNLKVELKLVRTFLIYVSDWDDDDASSSADRNDVVPELGSLVLDIEAALTEAMRESGDGEAELDPSSISTPTLTPNAISMLQDRITLLRPQIKAAYHCIISNNTNNNYSMESLSHHRSIMSYSDIWKAFAKSLETNLFELCSREDELVDPVVTHLRVMHELERSLCTFIFYIQYKWIGHFNLPTHFGAVLVRAAHVSYTCWIDRKKDESVTQELIGMLLDLLKEFKPNTPELMQLFLNLCRSSPRKEIFYEFLIHRKDGAANLWYGLEFLVKFAVDGPILYEASNDAKLLSKEIVATLTELGCLGYLFYVNVTDPALVKLLWKIELLKAEVFLLDYGYWGFKKNHSVARFQPALNLLRTCSKAPNNPIWMHFEPLIREAACVYPLSDTSREILFKLLDQITLFKMELLLEEELINRDSSVMVNVKSQMETFYDGLIVISTFLMGPREEHGKSILERAESVAREVASNYYTFYDPERKFFHLLPELVEKVELVRAEIKENYLQVRSSSQANFPKTDGFGFIDFLFENLRYLLNSNADSIAPLRHQIQVVHKDIEFLSSFFRDITEQHEELSDLENLVPFCIRVALEVEYLIDSFVAAGDVHWYHGMWLSDLIEDMKLIKIKASEITDKKHGVSVLDVPQSSAKVASVSKIPKIDEPMIDLADQTKLMIDMLMRGSLEHDVVSIVGMAGLGKTTLAKKLYNDPNVINHFHIHAWCCVSQAYQKRDLLLQILGDIKELSDDILEMSEEDLEMKLYRCLKRNTYLIVMDDLWSIEAWNDMSTSFPNDKNGSRILITSRHPVVSSKIKADRIPHPLRLLSDDESWKLLQKKLFKTKDCPAKLVAVGKQIAKGCQGLPLAVVAISGLLERTDMTLDWWKQVAETLSSHIVNDPETRCRDILELSYKYLPHYLKPCFLYLAAFGEDKEIPVCKLKWLWIADGLVQTTGLESAEDLAEEYLRDLVNRSLVIASKKRSSGGVKSCRVHDMLRTLCLLKCKEDSFLQWTTGYNDLLGSFPEDLDYGVDPSYHCPANSVAYEKRRVSIFAKRNQFVMSRPFGPHVRSLLYSASSDLYPRCPYDISFIAANFKLLRVLDLESINMGTSFPHELELLVHLRFLALCGDIDFIPESIDRLWNLEILLVRGLKGKVQLPNAIWRMAKLRHVHVNNNATLSLRNSKENSCQSCNLLSLSSPSLAFGDDSENIMRMCPKLQKLRCSFSESLDGNGNCNPFPALDFLTELESLNVFYFGRIAHPRRFEFPSKLKKLTLSKFRLPWDCISEIGRLPNLEVLKLLSRAFEGKVWNMKEGEFLKLKFLKLDTLNIAQWNASCDNLPNLQHLILRSCTQLEEIPSGFGDIDALEMIEVQGCGRSAEESVKRVKKEQLDMGNEELQVLINRSDWESDSIHTERLRLELWCNILFAVALAVWKGKQDCS